MKKLLLFLFLLASINAGPGFQGLGIGAQSTGKIIVAVVDEVTGNLLLLRYNTNGLPDDSFGSAGVIDTEQFITDSSFLRMVVLPNDKILIAYLNESDNLTMAARFNADGSHDTSFFRLTKRSTRMGADITDSGVESFSSGASTSSILFGGNLYPSYLQAKYGSGQ